jgi:predicted ATP-binding protein involved in virulence
MENFRIKHLTIKEIGPFESLDLDFPEKKEANKAEIHVFTGENGTGKTTLLQCLAKPAGFTDNATSTLFKKFWKIDDSTFFLKIYSSTIQYLLQNGNLSWIFSENFDKNLNDYPIKSYNAESNYFDYAFFAYSGHRNFRDEKIAGIEENLGNPLLNAVNFDQSINPKTILQWIANTKTKQYIAKGKGDLQKSAMFAAKITQIEQIITEIIGKKVELELDEDKFQILLKIDNSYLSFDQQPDGVKSLFGWVADLLMRLDRLNWTSDMPLLDRNFVLFLDEIEVHLHPSWQRKVLPVIQRLFKNAQIFISTHSPFVVGSVDGAWVHKFKKNGALAMLDGQPILSENANSYETILREIFGITQRYGLEIENDLDLFYTHKDLLLNNPKTDQAPIKKIILNLATQSSEMESLLGMEIKQIKRLTGIDLLAETMYERI